jgi:hypothetical protein
VLAVQDPERLRARGTALLDVTSHAPVDLPRGALGGDSTLSPLNACVYQDGAERPLPQHASWRFSPRSQTAVRARDAVMSVSMRWEQCCESEGCKRPARYGLLCVVCFMAATPARRVVELDTSRDDPLDALWSLPTVPSVTLARRAAEPDSPSVDLLEALWSLPALERGDS